MATTIQKKLVFFGDSLSDNGNLYRATGLPPLPYWQGRFSNGPTYAETLAAIVAAQYVSSTIYAYGGAEAAGSTFIDLEAQLAQYLATLPAGGSAAGTTAVINIGNNDYLTYDPSSGAPPVAEVLGSIQSAVQTLLARGVDKIVLVTLPDIGVTPRGAQLNAIDPNLVLGAHQIIEANNAGLKAMAAGLEASGVDVTVVDANRLAWEVFNDGTTFGFKTTGSVFGGALSTYAPNEVAFFDDIHPTYAFHGVAASFFAATLSADSVQLLDSGNNYIWGVSGSDLIFTGAGNDAIYGNSGNDTIFAGTGNDLALGGSGSDLVVGGSGNDTLFGNNGSDILADNAGWNFLDGGNGDDLLVINRLNANTVFGGNGNDLIILKDDVGAFAFQQIFGGNGIDTLRFIAAPRSFTELQAELVLFNELVADYSLQTKSAVSNGLALYSIEHLELQIDSYNPLDPEMPYLITHALAGEFGAPDQTTDAMAAMVKSAELWGLLTV